MLMFTPIRTHHDQGTRIGVILKKHHFIGLYRVIQTGYLVHTWFTGQLLNNCVIGHYRGTVIFPPKITGLLFIGNGAVRLLARRIAAGEESGY